MTVEKKKNMQIYYCKKNKKMNGTKIHYFKIKEHPINQPFQLV